MINKLIAALACAAVALPVAAQNSTGFREIKSEQFVFGVWYPAKEMPQKMRLGPFEVEYAKNAKPDGGMLPLAVLSHGANGYYRNHHLTASYLAQNGFIVAAPQHGKIGRKFSDMTNRVSEIKKTIAALQQEPDFKGVLDAGNINAIGYSRGGAAVLAAAGVNINISAYQRHCAKNYETDKNACGGFPWWARAFLQIKSAYFAGSEDEILDFSQTSAPFQKIILVAPVGQAADASSLATMRAKTLILQIENDEQLRAPHHSEYLRDNLPPDKTEHMLIKNAHHFAFTAPFPKWLAEKENIPAALDPPGFSRRQFIAEINEKILRFLKK